jgi:hypothetical protein
MLWVPSLGLGFVAGLAIGRWWALSLAVIPVVVVGTNVHVEVPTWFLAIGSGVIAMAGIAAGIAARRVLESAR